ncbi:hypothetical protein [Pseudomonas sp. TUM22785]|uniref:hypothetical protein n=1 Tax=Pseudomonas sp. TUM22785 TaxID=3019098 RepID=UPI0023050347|nr:hypothetical protein [Pseudomonas sp. TUM22785]WCD80236.1 hypothetical protein PI990_30395 [Pseudomonas sp. TUM22785]
MNIISSAFYKLVVILALFVGLGAFNKVKASSLCLGDEVIQLSFKVADAEKFVSLCEGRNQGYLVYRLGVPGDIEEQYPEQLNSESWRGFYFSGYSRGGGVANDAMGDYSLSFNRRGVSYTVFQGWRLVEGRYEIGVVIGSGGTRRLLSGAKEEQVGSLVRLDGKAMLKNRW